MASPNILIYGLQRSGTNFLEALQRRRFCIRLANRNGRRDRPEQKHFRLYADKELMPVAPFRNDLQVRTLAQIEAALSLPAPPDAYVLISKYPYAWYLSFRRWANQHDWPEAPYHFIQENKQFFRAWLTFSQETGRIHFVQYGQLRARPKATLSDLAAMAGLEPRRSPHLRKKYYLNVAYLAAFDPEELNALNRNLDDDVLNGLGYIRYEGL